MHGPTEFEAVDHFDLAAKVEAADRVACISDFARSQLMRLVDSTEWPKLDIVRMSVDLDRYGPPERLRSHDGPLRILSVGRLVPEKGALLLIDALADVVARGVDVDATLVGAGPLEPLLRERVGQAGLGEQITLTGSIGQDRLPDMYRRADIFCLPSFQEGLPVVLMEAMATGLPVVTTAIAGIPELVMIESPGESSQPAAPLSLRTRSLSWPRTRTCAVASVPPGVLGSRRTSRSRSLRVDSGTSWPRSARDPLTYNTTADRSGPSAGDEHSRASAALPLRETSRCASIVLREAW